MNMSRVDDRVKWRSAWMLVAGLVSAGSLTLATAQQPSEDRVTVPLSDPSKPALIDVSLVSGSITVRGSNRKDLAVIARADAEQSERRSRRYDPDATGVRRIPQTAGFKITEEANRVKIGSDNPNRN